MYTTHSRLLSAGLALLLALAALPGAGTAQEMATGRIVGRVLDAGSGRALTGAQVAVQGTALRTVAGVDGRYTLASVPAGSRALAVSLVGYATKTVTGVEVPADGAATLDVTLAAEAVAIEGLTVSAAREKGSVSAALDEQRTSTGVVSAITTEQIARSPDSDAAQAVQRVSGVTVQDGKFVVVRGLGERYTTTSLNGARIPSPEPERRVVPLDLFPAGLLQTITTAKTFTPNLPGDFSGAQVDIRTREFPGEQQVSLSTSLSFNPSVTGRTLYLPPTSSWLAFGDARREIPAPVLQAGDFQRPVSQAEFNRMVESFRNVWTPREAAGAPGSSLAASVGGTGPVLGREVGYLLSGTYSRSQEALTDQVRAQALVGQEGAAVEVDRFEGATGRWSVLWGGLLNVSTDFGAHTRISLNNSYNRSADSEARAEVGVSENLGQTLAIDRLRTVIRAVRSSQLRGEHTVADRHRVDWSLTSSRVARSEPDRSEIVYALDAGPSVQAVRRAEWLAGSNEAAIRTFGALEERSAEGALDYTLTLGSGFRRHELRFGGLFRATDRNADNRAYSISAPGTLGPEGRALAPEEIFDGRYTGPDQAVFRVVPVGAGGSYTARDRLAAGYAMAEVALTGQLRLVGGARVERSEVAVEAVPTFGERVESTPEYTDVLPSAALNVDITDWQKLRFAVSQTLSRPEYRELAPILYRDVIGGDNVVGNPELRRTLVRNLDARWEWYPASDEVLSVGVFAKRFQEPIERVYLATSGSRIVRYENAEGAQNYGVELEARKTLGFLGERGYDFTAFANATLMRSDIRLRGGDGARTRESRPMVGQSPYVVNAGLTYAPASGATSATVLYNVVGERIVSAGELPLPDVYEQPRHVLDLSLRQRLYRTLSLKLDAENLLDASYRTVQGGVVRERYRTGRTFSLGVSWLP